MFSAPCEFILENEQDSKALAQKIATNLKLHDVLAFTGDLGAGKSFFCREIIKSLCGQQINVISPTFNLLQIYESKNFSIYHFDLYRLKHQSEVYELGIEEAFDSALSLIEWPEIIGEILPKGSIFVDIKIISDSSRRVSIRKD
ncbi:MAG: tRNA (adenosine(37)-N6)-threonylcarbamoyltransferase complex ATPase subunit type 1 TsaE [Rickettsiales bacterium]|nr:MAG: tRNA (adenosine(37)-N6)-threonylcarbamoyltransferase complex ATPase subunit type 1 TsaE [Rickettsiales bacterium]